jgi:thymidylate synthase (FAD)
MTNKDIGDMDMLELMDYYEINDNKNFKCEKCGTTKALTIHHIKPVCDYPELKAEPANLMTLCIKCHRKEHKDD